MLQSLLILTVGIQSSGLAFHAPENDDSHLDVLLASISELPFEGLDTVVVVIVAILLFEELLCQGIDLFVVALDSRVVALVASVLDVGVEVRNVHKLVFDLLEFEDGSVIKFDEGDVHNLVLVLLLFLQLLNLLLLAHHNPLKVSHEQSLEHLLTLVL